MASLPLLTRRGSVGKNGGILLSSGKSNGQMVRRVERSVTSLLKHPEGSLVGKTSSLGQHLPELGLPSDPVRLRGDAYLSRRGIQLPVVHQQNIVGEGGSVNGECYLLDGTRTDLLDVAVRALKEDKLVEFNKFKEFKKFKGKNNEFSLVSAGRLAKVFRPDRSAVHFNRLLLAVIPALNQGIPGRTRIKLTDARMQDDYGTLFQCSNPVTSGYIYCINLGYSVPAVELDFRLKVEFEDVPIKDGCSPIWIKTAFHLCDRADPVFLAGTMSMGVSILANSHTDMLSDAALLLNETSNRSHQGEIDCELRDDVVIVAEDTETKDKPDVGVTLTPPVRVV